MLVCKHFTVCHSAMTVTLKPVDQFNFLLRLGVCGDASDLQQLPAHFSHLPRLICSGQHTRQFFSHHAGGHVDSRPHHACHG